MLCDALKLHNPSDSIPHFAYARKLDKKDILRVCWYAKKILKLTVEFKKFKLGLVQTCVGRLTIWKKNIFTPRYFCPDFNFQTHFFFASIDHQRKSIGPRKNVNRYYRRPSVLIQGQSWQTGFFELALRDRNMQVRFFWKVLLKSWDLRNFAS